MQDEIKLVGTLAGVGALIGIAKMLNSDEPLKARHVVGRAILSGACGTAAGAIVLFFPGAGFVVQVAVACVLASLGVSALEAVFKKWLKK